MAKGFLDGYSTYDPSENGYGNAREWKVAFHQRMSKEDATALLGNKAETPYDILGITDRSTKKEIKAAFRKLITEWHPDKNQHRVEEAERMTKKIIAAYTLLS